MTLVARPDDLFIPGLMDDLPVFSFTLPADCPPGTPIVLRLINEHTAVLCWTKADGTSVMLVLQSTKREIPDAKTK